MKNSMFSRISFFSFVFFFTSLLSAKTNVLVYLAGANDLDQFIQLNENQMMAVGSNNNVNILVYESTHFTGKNKETKKLFVNKGSMTQYGPTEVRDSGSIDTLKDALAWEATFPADNTVIVFWDHGSGVLNYRGPIPSSERGVCYDFDTGNYLSDRDLLSALSWGRDVLRNGKKYDIVAFDACLMASIEIVFTLASCTNYVVASEETIPGTGFDYQGALSPFSTGNIDPLAFSKHLVAAYNKAYMNVTDDYTLSAVDVQAMQSFIINLNNVAQFLTKQLQGARRTSVKAVIKKCISPYYCSCFNNVYIDLLQFYKNLYKNVASLRLSASETSQLNLLLSKGIAMFPNFIKANAVGISYRQAGGLTIYFDSRSIDTSYPELYWTEINQWWLNFLKAYRVV